MGFDFSSEERRQLGYRLIDRIDKYYSSLDNRAIQPPADERAAAHVPLELPEFGSDATRILDELCREMIDKGFHIPAANYFGLMNPTPAYMAVLAEALVAALNPQLASVRPLAICQHAGSGDPALDRSRFGWQKPSPPKPPARPLACDGPSPPAETRPTSPRWRWPSRIAFPMRLRTASPPSARGPSSTPHPNRITRWRSPPACSA